MVTYDSRIDMAYSAGRASWFRSLIRNQAGHGFVASLIVELFSRRISWPLLRF